MTFSSELDPALNDFSGFAPLFPLPNVVLFPHALLPLQIFEPRYRKMTADVLEGERLIAMGLLKTGWERLPPTAVPPVHRTVGIGKIIAHEKLEDGRYYLVLRGLVRANLVSEKLVDLPYRIGQLELCPDVIEENPIFGRSDRTEELLARFAKTFPQVNLQKLFLHAASELPLATVCDVLLGSMPLAPEMSQVFLDERNADVRSQMLMNLLDQSPSELTSPLHRTFPPIFSSN